MDFPITELMDPDPCYATLVGWLHPVGLPCRRCRRGDRMRAYRNPRPLALVQFQG